MPAAFPLPAIGGPQYSSYNRSPRDWTKSVLTWVMKDGSATFNRQAPTAPIYLYLDYDNLTDAERIILDAHYDSCSGEWLGFDFTDPRTGEVLTNVHYDDFKMKQKKISWRKGRTVVLVKRAF